MLVHMGAALIDADAVSRQLTAPRGAALPAIAAHFGPQALQADDALNRAWLRERIFRDPEARRTLEGIVHPLVDEEIARALAACTAPVAVIDIPLLVESERWRSQLDGVVVVDCSAQTQRERVQRRSGWTLETIDAALTAQASRPQRLAAADWVVFNDGHSLDGLRDQVTRLGRLLGL